MFYNVSARQKSCGCLSKLTIEQNTRDMLGYSSGEVLYSLDISVACMSHKKCASFFKTREKFWDFFVFDFVEFPQLQDDSELQLPVGFR